MTQVIKGVGRDGSFATLRTLLVLAARLQHEGDALSPATVMQLLGVSRADAAAYLSVLMDVGDEDTPCYLPLIEDENAVALASRPHRRCKDLRLSHLETMALAAALDTSGIKADNQLRARIMTVFAHPKDAGANFSETPRPSYPIPTDTLLRCAAAIVNKSAVTFEYQGTRDDAPRLRRVRPTTLNPNDGKWTLDAFDLDADGERTFYLANMEKLTLLDATLPGEAAPVAASHERRSVELRFSDRHMLDLFDWPDLEIVREDDDAILARIPFYGGPWLVRRIAAGGGSITTTDSELNALVRAYAENQLGA